MTIHSKLGASSMARWSACAGSVKKCENLPNIAGPWAEKGTQSHSLAEGLVNHRLWPKKYKYPRKLLDQAPSGMLEAVEVYVDYVCKLANEDGTTLVKLEYGFNISKQIGVDGMFSTLDFVSLNEKKRRLTVVDYKNGYRFVDANNNLQTQYYGLGGVLSLNLIKKIDTVELVIVQPNAPKNLGDSIRSEILDVEDLTFDFFEELKSAALETQNPNAKLVPGKVQCQYCPASGNCEAQEKEAQAIAKLDYKPVGKSKTYDPKKLAQALDKVELVKLWAKAVYEFAYQEAQAGRIPPGYKLIAKRGTRTWKNPGAAEFELVHEMDIPESEVYKSDLKSVTQIEEVLKTPKQKKKIAHLWHKISSGNKLVKLSEKGEPVKISTAQDDFKVIA